MTKDSKELILQKTFSVAAPPSKVWAAITDPDKIKLWLFGTTAITDWKPGSPILFTGNWNGSNYTDKGTILQCDVEKILKYDYWSGFSGLPDTSENYSILTFEILATGNSTALTLRQTNFATESMYEHSDKNWDTTLATLKQVIENS